MILFFLLPFLALPVSSYLDNLYCYPPSYFAVDLSHGTKAHVHRAELSVLFSRDRVHVYTYPDTDAVNILLNDTIITFKGNLSTGNSAEQPRKIDHAVSFQLKGFGKLKNHDSKAKLQECEIHLTSSQDVGWEIPREVENKFRGYAENCITSQMCTKIGSVQPEDYTVSTNPHEFGPLSVYSKSQNQNSHPAREPPLNHESKKSVQLQSHINTIVDIALAEVVNHLKGKHEKRIKIPDIDQRFSVGSGIFKTDGRFDATDGYFSDLPTLKRTKDAVLDRQGFKFLASCGFGLSNARIEYNHYKLKFGLIKVRGKVSADINGISIDAKVSVDYNEHPCKANLEYLKIVEFGKVEIEVTSFGPLNSLASSLVTWITKTWKTDIAGLIEAKVTEVINYQLSNFKCERYRP